MTTKPYEMTLAEYRKAFKPVRCFHRYSSEQRADMRSSHRLGYKQKNRFGDFFYITDHCPGVAFNTFGEAARAGHRRVIEEAIAAGLLVPDVAVAFYPDLAAKRPAVVAAA